MDYLLKLKDSWSEAVYIGFNHYYRLQYYGSCIDYYYY